MANLKDRENADDSTGKNSEPERRWEMTLEEKLAHLQAQTRRHFLRSFSAGVGAMFLGTMGSQYLSSVRAAELDPDEDDYPFNLGLVSLQNNDFAAATARFRDAAEREPDNPEDRAFLINALEKAGKKDEAAEARGAAFEAFGPNGLPVLKLDDKPESLAKYQRVSRELDITSLRMQLATPAAVNNSSAESTSPIDPVVAHLRRGRQELGAGRLDNAEKEFRAALAADPKNAPAHRELADVARRRGKLDEAVQELQTSLALRDSATGRVMLARIYLEQKKPELARAEVEKAVKLAPNYAEARQLLDHLEKNKPAGGKP